MQEYWESYAKPIEGKKAIVSFNAGMADSVPNAEYIYAGFVKVKLHNPTEDGLVTKEESDDVGFIEDRLEMESLRWRSGKYIGRVISQGEVHFIYYLKMDFEWRNTVESAMNYFSNYEYEFGSRIDIEWEIYQKLLFPTTREWQIIANHHSCDSLKKQGDTLKVERAIEHKVYFENKINRKKFIALLEEKGFHKQKSIEVPFQGKTIYGIQFYKKGKPHYYEIDALTIEIIDMSESLDGMYDGWECSLLKE